MACPPASKRWQAVSGTSNELRGLSSYSTQFLDETGDDERDRCGRIIKMTNTYLCYVLMTVLAKQFACIISFNDQRAILLSSSSLYREGNCGSERLNIICPGSIL